MWVGMGVIWREPQLGKGMGWGPTSPPPKRKSERRGPAASHRATWVSRVPRGRRRGGPTVAPPRTGVKKAGGAAAGRAGTGPASSRPRLGERPPPPGQGKGREEGGRARRPDAGASPAAPRGAGAAGSRLPACSSAGSFSPFRTRGSSPRAWHPRGASSPRSRRVAPTASRPAAPLLAQPTPFQPAARGAPCSQRGPVSLSSTPLQVHLSHACLPSLRNTPAHEPGF